MSTHGTGNLYFMAVPISARMIADKLIAILAAAMVAIMVTNAIGTGVPIDNLPEGFKLWAVINSSTPRVNVTEEFIDFCRPLEIGEVNATVGKYLWGVPGVDWDAKVTVLELSSPEYARAAYDNYINLKDYKYPAARGVDRFANATVNGHPALEIRDLVENTRGSFIKLMYLWTNQSTVVLVEGNDMQNQSLALAEATEL